MWRSVAGPTEPAALPDPAELVLAVLAASITILVPDRAVVENIQQRTHEMVYATLRSPRYAGVAPQVMPAIEGVASAVLNLEALPKHNPYMMSGLY